MTLSWWPCHKIVSVTFTFYIYITFTFKIWFEIITFLWRLRPYKEHEEDEYDVKFQHFFIYSCLLFIFSEEMFDGLTHSQSQFKTPDSGKQCPPFKHVLAVQYSFSHLFPDHPLRQTHSKLFCFWMHASDPSAEQGFNLHSSMSASQLCPVNPDWQRHLKPLSWSMQLPPFKHESGLQSSTLISQNIPNVPDGQEHRKSSTRS